MNNNTTKQEGKQEKRAVKVDGESGVPVHTVRQGAVAASIWMRQSPSGYAYLDFSLSRSWKSMSTARSGYSRNFFVRNRAELKAVIEQACEWIERQEGRLAQDEATPSHAA